MAVEATYAMTGPNAVEIVYFTERMGVVTLTEPDGTPLDSTAGPITGRVAHGITPEATARKLFRDQISNFHRPLTYEATGWR